MNKIAIGDKVEVHEHPSKVRGIVKQVIKDTYTVEFLNKDLFPSNMNYKEKHLLLVGKYLGCFHDWEFTKGFNWDFWLCVKCGIKKNYNPMEGDIYDK